MDNDIDVFAIILGALSRPTCMSADGQANLAALPDKQEQFTYSSCFVAGQSSFASETHSSAWSSQLVTLIDNSFLLQM